MSERSGPAVENIIDAWIDTNSAPHRPTTDAEIDRIRTSAYFIHGNYVRLADLGPDIANNGLIRIAKNGNGYGDIQTKGEALRRVHNYLSSLYSYNMQVIEHINEKTTDKTYDKYDLLPGTDVSEQYIPSYIKKNCFLHGLRNDIQHGEYHCLRVDKEREDEEYEYYHLRFIKGHFEPRATGGLENSGDYLRYTTKQDREYPLPYICEFHDEFNQFETDLEDWCSRSRTNS